MERRFELRKEALLAECEVSPRVFWGAIERLERFIEPFADLLVRKEQQQHALTFLSGLVSDLDRKNTEAIAHRDDQQRKELQHFIGESNWDDRRLRMELARQVGQQIGCADGVIVFDPSAFPKKGTESVGVKRQWCGRLGKTDNCQVGIYMGYISSQERALVDVRLYLPQEWAKDRKRRKKCKAAKVENRIEECIKRGKSEAGLADYQVRSWPGWHHHQTLSLITAWFLILETRRGKKMDTSDDGSTDSRRHRAVATLCLRLRLPHTHRSRTHPKTPTQPTRPPLPLEMPRQVATIEPRKETDLEQ